MFINNFFFVIKYSSKNSILKYKEYISLCRKHSIINQQFHFKSNYIFLSICLPAYNMEKYLTSSILSIINQSFQFFEIIIVNDNSNDNTQNIIKQFQSKDKRIKCINHSKNQGVYISRADAILNANGEYILLMDPDDILLNQEIFEELYSYNNKYYLDIIEFLVFHQEEGKKSLIFPKDHTLNHYHNYKQQIIIQPELSDIIFYKPNSKEYSSIICRTIWNKLIKKKILIKAIHYLNNDNFKKKFLIAADDTPINILSFHYGNNYSNINIPGYLYILRENGMSKDNNGNIKHDITHSYNFLVYFRFLYKYVTKFNKDINFFLYDFQCFSTYLLKLKDLNVTEYIPMGIKLFETIRKRNISEYFEKIVDELIYYFLKL